MNRQSDRQLKVYGGSCLVLLVSFVAAWLLPTTDFFKGLASVPGVGALLNVIFQLWRDERAHERGLEVLQRQQDFALATASHMATIAYDKHVAFCEAYIAEVTRGLDKLAGSGPSKQALDLAGTLQDTRKQHTTWLTAEIEDKLLPFESALRKMGAGEGLLPHLQPGERLNRLVDEIHESFGLIIGTEHPVTDEQAAIVAARIVDHVRDIVGIKELTQLRLSATRFALDRVSQTRS